MNRTGTSTAEPPPRWLAVAHATALIADALVVGSVVAIAVLSHRRLELHFAVMMMGAALAIVSLAAAWLALGPMSNSARLVAAPLVSLAALIAMTILMAALDVNPSAVFGAFLAGTAQFMLLQIPYWLFRSLHRLRIVHDCELAAGGAPERLQYSLWQMLLVMTLVALALGAGRWILTLVPASINPGGSELTLAAFFVLLVGYNLLLAWPLLWAVLAPNGVLRRLAAAVVLVALVLVSAYPLCVAVLGPGEGPWIFWLVFAPQPAFLLTHLLATRLCGYRLVRWIAAGHA